MNAGRMTSVRLKYQPSEIAEKEVSEIGQDGENKRSVRFEVPNTTSKETSKSKVKGAEVPAKLNNICSELFGRPAATFRKGSLGHIGLDKRPCAISIHHEVHLLEGKPTVKSSSLKDLLEENSRRSFGCTIPRGERLSIALTLASSILQLDGTSWLKSCWSSQDIMLYYQDTFATHRSRLHKVIPYVVWDLCSPKAEDIRNFGLEEDVARQIRCDETLLALGMTLIELCYGRTLLSMRSPDCEQPDEIGVKLLTAFNLLDELKYEADDNYATVVNCCMNNEWKRDKSLDRDPKFERDVFEHIVLPLANELEHFHGKGNRVGRNPLERRLNQACRVN